MLFAPEVIKIFAGKNYYEAIYIVPPVALSVYFIFIYSLFSNVEYYFQKTKLIALATSVCAILNLLLNYIFIDLFGYYAAGYTTLISYIFLSVLHYIFYRRLLSNMTIHSLYNIKGIFIISVILIIIMMMAAFSYKVTFIRYLLVVCIVIVCTLFRKKIMLTIKNIKQ